MTNFFYKNLLGLAAEEKLSISAVATRAKLPPSTLTRLVRRGPENANPSDKTMKAVADAFGCPYPAIAEISLFDEKAVDEGAGLRKTAQEQMCDALLSRGELTSQNIDIIAKHRAKPSNSDAMAPTIRDGDILFVETPEEAKSGDIVIAEKKDGREVVARLLRDGATLWGKFDNENWPGDKIFPINEIKWKVIGLKRMF